LAVAEFELPENQLPRNPFHDGVGDVDLNKTPVSIHVEGDFVVSHLLANTSLFTGNYFHVASCGSDYATILLKNQKARPSARF
jgi:hypothetical protein